jgi:hypothetical protein
MPYSALFKFEDTLIVPLAGSIIDDLQLAGGVTFGQEDFASYQWWYKDYPDAILAVTSLGALSGGILPVVKIVFTPEPEYITKYPENYVTQYDPDTDPVPDPNGEDGETTSSATNGAVSDFATPRWHTSTPYDLSVNPTEYLNMVPPLEFDYGYTDSGSVLGVTTTNYPKDSYSMKVSTPSNVSEVINENTGDPEYYPFSQATLTYEKESKFKVVYDGEICCWNKGVTLKGKVSYSTVDLISTALENPAGSGYGYGGLQIETGDTYEAHSEATWEVVIEEDYEPAEISIPKVEGKAVFINDFYITEVIKPT